VTTPTSAARPWALRADLLAPALFVLLWSTGFIGAKLGLPYAEPFTFLLIRFVLATALLGGLALALGAPWPRRPAQYGHSAVVGLLLQGVYLSGVFWAIHRGMSAGLAALIVGLQPLLTAVLGQVMLGERVSPRQWLGLLLGLTGVGLVLGEPLLRAGGVVAPTPAIAAALIALLGGTFGTLYQRRFCRNLPLLSGTATQFLAAGALMLLVAPLTETMEVRWTPAFTFALAWLVLVMSCGAVVLLMVLIRRTTAARVASLFYLVPPATAVEAYLLFGERLGPLALLGMLAAVLGVALVVAAERP
jgi:drug/metabolite transporter (DMT)-like permease